jgi:hypothetical protein
MYLDPTCASHKQGLKEAYDWIADEISGRAAEPAEARKSFTIMWELETVVKTMSPDDLASILRNPDKK